MVSDVADVIGMWKLNVERDSQVAFVVALLVRIVVAVPVVTNI